MASSLLRQQSISNYGLLPDTLMRIMKCHAIQPSFADLLFGFRNPRPHAESGYGIWHASVGAGRGFGKQRVHIRRTITQAHGCWY